MSGPDGVLAQPARNRTARASKIVGRIGISLAKFSCTSHLARGGNRKIVDAPHFVVVQHGSILEEGFHKIDRVCAPKYLSVDDEARYPEHAARGGIFRVLP